MGSAHGLRLAERGLAAFSVRAGCDVEVTASSWPYAEALHRWSVEVFPERSNFQSPLRFSYGLEIRGGDEDQRIAIPALGENCVFQVRVSRRTASGWEQDDAHLAIDESSWLALGFAPADAAPNTPDACVLAFHFARRRKRSGPTGSKGERKDS